MSGYPQFSRARSGPENGPHPEPPVGQGGYRLNGHSGAELVLVRRGDVHVVRKTAGSPAQNERLLQQAASQRQFFFSGLPFPRVLSEGTDDSGLAFFEMEYVPGQTVGHMICQTALFDVDIVVAALHRLFDLLRLTASGTLPPELFYAKIAQIEACRSEACLPHLDGIATIAKRLRQLSWEAIPQSTGHGDLTLENVLFVQQRGVVFIDCDVCFASSFWLDAAKLFQDIAGHWCLRRFYLSDGSGPSTVNAIEQLNRLAPPMHALMRRLDPDLERRLPGLTALHLYRVVPYVKDARVVSFILKRIAAVLSHAGL